jgi:hypothetical protein
MFLFECWHVLEVARTRHDTPYARQQSFLLCRKLNARLDWSLPLPYLASALTAECDMNENHYDHPTNLPLILILSASLTLLRLTLFR